jgi:hypothetical protein
MVEIMEIIILISPKKKIGDPPQSLTAGRFKTA